MYFRRIPSKSGPWGALDFALAWTSRRTSLHVAIYPDLASDQFGRPVRLVEEYEVAADEERTAPRYVRSIASYASTKRAASSLSGVCSVVFGAPCLATPSIPESSRVFVVPCHYDICPSGFLNKDAKRRARPLEERRPSHPEGRAGQTKGSANALPYQGRSTLSRAAGSARFYGGPYRVRSAARRLLVSSSLGRSGPGVRPDDAGSLQLWPSRLRTSRGNSSGGTARLKRNPWAFAQSMPLRRSICSWVSTPSATISRPRARPKSMMVWTIATQSPFARPAMNERSILSVWMG